MKGMKSKLADDHPEYLELSSQHVLGNCEDFREEIGAMQELVQSHGNIVQFSPKGHPEISCGRILSQCHSHSF